MTDMSEHVGHAIAAVFTKSDLMARLQSGAEVDGEYVREQFTILGRVAIEAMREPTEAMVEAGASELRAMHDAEIRTHHTPPFVWRGMIDEALT